MPEKEDIRLLVLALWLLKKIYLLNVYLDDCSLEIFSRDWNISLLQYAIIAS